MRIAASFHFKQISITALHINLIEWVVRTRDAGARINVSRDSFVILIFISLSRRRFGGVHNNEIKKNKKIALINQPAV